MAFEEWMLASGISWNSDLIRLVHGADGTGGGVFAASDIKEGDVLCW